MKLITEHGKIRGVAARWGEQYRYSTDADKLAIKTRLLALPENATAADVFAVIGNDSWTRLTCDECKRDVKAVAQLGDEPDYESSTVLLCVDCAVQTLELLRGAGGGG